MAHFELLTHQQHFKQITAFFNNFELMDLDLTHVELFPSAKFFFRQIKGKRDRRVEELPHPGDMNRCQESPQIIKKNIYKTVLNKLETMNRRQVSSK